MARIDNYNSKESFNFYSSFDEIYHTLAQINEGIIQLSSEKWRLLLPEKR